MSVPMPQRISNGSVFPPMLQPWQMPMQHITGIPSLLSVCQQPQPGPKLPMHQPTHVVLIGDSIAAMQGIPSGSGFVSLVRDQLQKFAIGVDSWSQGGVAAVTMERELPQLVQRLAPLAQGAQLIVVIELGGNDRLMGVQPGKIVSALVNIVRKVRGLGAKCVLMEVIPDGLDREVARQCGCGLSVAPPCIFGGAAGGAGVPAGHMPQVNTAYLQQDGVHPNEHAQRPIAKQLLLALSRETRLPLSEGFSEQDACCSVQ